MPLNKVDAYFTDLKLSGVFDQIKGLIVGRPFRYNKEQVRKFKEVILENTKDCDFPILYGADIGHTNPIITIPLGAEVKIDSEKDIFSINETGVV